MSCSTIPSYDFCIYRGEDREFFFSFSYLDENNQKEPLILDGYEFLMSLELNRPKKVKLDILSTENGRLTRGQLIDNKFQEGANATILSVKFPHEVTSTFSEGVGNFDLIKIDSNGNREMLVFGNVMVHKGVSYA